MTMEDPQGLPLQWQVPPQEQRQRLTHAGDRRVTKMTQATLVQHANTHQVDPNPPRFEIIESDDQSDDPTTSSEEAESVESPPAEATPTTL